jgi:hypothetical protein
VPNRTRITRAFPALLAACAALGLWCGSSPAAGTQILNATFNPDGSMRLALADGTSVGTSSALGTAIPPGPYLVVVNNNDSSQNFGDTHNFHLSGPGVSAEAILTQQEETQATWTVTFQPNATYTFQDDYRPTLIHVVFRTSSTAPSAAVTGTATTPPSSGKSSGAVAKNPSVVGSALTPDPFRGTLTASVGRTGSLSLTRSGRNVTSLKAGRYRVVVTDRSTKSGFIIQEIRKPARTVSGGAFTGKRSVTLSLKPGQWFFYSTFLGKKNYFIVAA